jgi:hypothetical protein
MRGWGRIRHVNEAQLTPVPQRTHILSEEVSANASHHGILLKRIPMNYLSEQIRPGVAQVKL